VFCEISNIDLLTMSKGAYCNMKIKEKGLTVRAAKLLKSGEIPGRKGFNAFKEKNKAKAKAKEKKPEPQEQEKLFLDFLGTQLSVFTEDGGSVAEADVPYVRGATLKFSGCGGNVKYSEVKVRS